MIEPCKVSAETSADYGLVRLVVNGIEQPYASYNAPAFCTTPTGEIYVAFSEYFSIGLYAIKPGVAYRLTEVTAND